MGDISELRGLIVVGTFITALILLVIWIPSGFLIASPTERQIEPPDYFEAIDLEYFSDNWNQTLDDSGNHWAIGSIDYWDYDFTLGGYYFRLRDTENAGNPYRIWLYHYDMFWIFIINIHECEWINNEGLSRGDYLTPTILDLDYTEGNIKYSLKCDHMTMMGFFGFNETTYSSPSEAWENDDLRVLFAIEFDQVNTSINAWSIIAGVLFFGLPNVHWIIDTLIHIPIWLAEIYITYILILRAIGAIFGGGA